jgi:hypothetical protein
MPLPPLPPLQPGRTKPAAVAAGKLSMLLLELSPESPAAPSGTQVLPSRLLLPSLLPLLQLLAGAAEGRVTQAGSTQNSSLSSG